MFLFIYFLKPANLCIRANASFTSIIGCFVCVEAILLEADPSDSLIGDFLAVALKDSVNVSNTNFTSLTVSALSNVTSAISGSALGKAVGGLTSSVSGIVGDLGRTLDSTIGALQSVTLPLGEITARVTQTENLVNGLRGDILSLTGTERNTTLGKIDTVSTLASSKNIDFNIDQDITTAINVVKNVGVAAFETVTGKRLYPKTESVQVPSSNTG